MMCGSAWADPVVPDVVGMTEADANGAITAVDNLTVGIVAYDYNDIMAAGLVVSQDPLAGTEVPIGSSIDLVVSLGQPVVPDVVGQMEADANMAIVSVDNLHIGDITYEYNEIVAAGCVIGQSPVGGTAVPIGSPVDVVVSLGQPVVPDVVGQTEADANMAIVSVDNLYIGEITYEYSEIVAAGLVISQSPVGGTPVPIGSPIDLVVSLGAPDPNSLVAHWEFDEGAGTTAYDSAGDNDGTLVNGPTWTTGVLDGALDFDGVDDYVNVGQPESLQNMGKGSIVLWFKPDVTIDNTLDTYLSLFEKNRYGAAYDGDTTLAFTRHSGDQGRLSIDITNDTGGQFIVYSDNSLWPGGAWQHVAATWDNATGVIRMFINGVEQIDRIDDFTGITMSAARDVTMGGNSEKTMYWWEGAIDEVRVYNRALSAEEIQHLYEQGLPGVFYVDGVNGSDLNDGRGGVCDDSKGYR
jgi:beta-lactam-binding protein with PASTA domain